MESTNKTHPIHLHSDITLSTVLNSIDTVLCDFSGTLWKKTKEPDSPTIKDVINGSQEAIKLFRKAGKKVIYVTSSITLRRKDYVKRLKDFDFNPDVDNQDVFSPGYVLARYLQARHFKKKVFLVGKKEQSISEELDEVGISSVWSEDSDNNIKSGKEWSLKHYFAM